MPRLSFQHQILAGFVITLIAVFSGVFMAYNRIDDFQKDGTAVDQTQEILKFTNQVLINVGETESSVRGYIATGQSSYLDHYNDALSKITPSVDRLTFLLNTDTQQQALADSLKMNVSQKLYALTQVLWIANLKGMATAQQQLADDTTMKTLQSLIELIKSRESRLLEKRRQESNQNAARTIKLFYAGSFFIVLLVLLLFLYIRRSFYRQKMVEERLMNSNFQLEEISTENKAQNQLLSGTSELDRALRGEPSVNELAQIIIENLCQFTSASVASVYIFNSHNQRLELKAKYAYEQALKESIRPGEGLIGQAALDKKSVLVQDLQKNALTIATGFANMLPGSVLIQPFVFNNELKGVIELGFPAEINDTVLQFIQRTTDSIAIAIHTAQSRIKIQELFDRAQKQAMELENQHEELRITNEDLMSKTSQLQSSEEELRVQQEELYQMNADLAEKARLLEERNFAIDEAREAISLKMAELEQTSKYKSEFLANMSHELRTPLNSVLILAKILSENKHKHLSEEEVKFASVIHNAGSDLLTLINDILDLAKVESGHIELDVRNVKVKDFKHNLELLFTQTAKNKSIGFEFNIDATAPEFMKTDDRRVEQVLKNLLSNAFKFTPEKGHIKVNIASYEQDGQSKISFAIIDSGIGIPEDKLETVFEAFKQADGSTSRIYGGTGLGLSISRELAQLLGGDITLESSVGKGSTFTLVLPLEIEAGTSEELTSEISEITNALSLKGQAKSILIIEDDLNFATIAKKLTSDRGFIPTLASEGDTGLRMAKEMRPDAILLDIMLPVMDGWTVLKNLKSDPETRHIPVHLMSAKEESFSKARNEGALGFMKKPIEKTEFEKAIDQLINANGINLRKVLLIEDNEVQSDILKDQLTEINVHVVQAFRGLEALGILDEQQDFDCIILDINLPDISGLDLLDEIKAKPGLDRIPVVINTAMELDRQRLQRITQYTNSMVFKTQHSNSRLVEEVNLFIDKIKAQGPMQTSSQEEEKIVIDETPSFSETKTVLLVDDDIRNIFALTSALSGSNLKFEIAYNGKEALAKLEDNPAIDIVLMDIMMPVMNGYDAIKAIRENPLYSHLPVIAITAKAMNDDRLKCLDAGANEYISKPVQVDKLLVMMNEILTEEEMGV